VVAALVHLQVDEVATAVLQKALWLMLCGRAACLVLVRGGRQAARGRIHAVWGYLISGIMHNGRLGVDRGRGA
jgi:hypothetical protein